MKVTSTRRHGVNAARARLAASFREGLVERTVAKSMHLFVVNQIIGRSARPEHDAQRRTT